MWSTLARSGRSCINKANTPNTASRSHRIIRSEKRYLTTEPKPNPPQQAAKPPTNTNTTPPPPKPNTTTTTTIKTQPKPVKSHRLRTFLLLTTLGGAAVTGAVLFSAEDSKVKQYAYQLLNIDAKPTLLSKQLTRAIETPHMIEPRDSQPISAEPEDEVTVPSEEQPVGIIEVETDTATPVIEQHVTPVTPDTEQQVTESRDQIAELEHVLEVVEQVPEHVLTEAVEQLPNESAQSDEPAASESVPAPFSEPEVSRDQPASESVPANESEETRVQQLTARIGELQDKMSSLEQIKAQMDELAQRMSNETSKEAEVVKEVVKKLQLQNEEERARFASELNEQRRALEEKYAQEIEQALQVVGREMEDNLSSLQQAYVAQHQSRIQKLQQLQSVVQQESNAREMYRQYDYESQRMHLLDIVLINLFNKIVDRKPFVQELQSLKAAAKGNEALELAVNSIPERVASEGLVSIEDLKQEFDRISRSLRRATLLPEDKESGPFSELYATVVERLRHATKYKYDTYLDGEDGWAVLSRVEYELKRQNVRASVKELESLSKLNNKVPAELARAWLERAKQHLITLQALHILQANATAQTVQVLSKNPFNHK